MQVKKGIWVNIDDIEQFRECQEDLLTAMKHQDFSEIGISMKTREGLRPFGVLDDFLDIWHGNGLKVFAWLVCLIDESVDETILCRNSANEVIESYVCPTKASQAKIIDWEGEKITYLESLKRTIKKLITYEIDGVHLVEVRYPTYDSCWCNECRKEISFGKNTFDLTRSENIKEWVDLRVNKIKEIWGLLAKIIRSANVPIIGNAVLDFESYGRMGEKIFHGVDVEYLQKASDCLSVRVEPYLGLKYKENAEMALAFLRYMDSSVAPIYTQFMGVIETSEYQRVNRMMHNTGIPYHIIIPSPEVLISWDKGKR